VAAKQAKKKVQRAKEALYRQLVMDAAERVFAQKGYDDTKMEEIATESGLSLQTLYAVFSGKAALYQELNAAGAEELQRRTADSVRGISDPGEAILAGVRAYTHYFLEHPNFLRMNLRDGLTWGGEGAGVASHQRTEAWRAGVEQLTAAVKGCIERGTFHDRDPRLIARMMVAMQQVELAHWLDGRMRTDPEQVVREIQDQVVRAFRCGSAEDADGSASL
jgi:AcrR family transcriptional regulator